MQRVEFPTSGKQNASDTSQARFMFSLWPPEFTSVFNFLPRSGPGEKGSGKFRVGCWKNLTELSFSPSKKTETISTVGVKELVSLPMSGFGLTTRPVLLSQQLGLYGMCAIHCGRPEHLILRAPLEQLGAMPTSIGYAFGFLCVNQCISLHVYLIFMNKISRAIYLL